MVVRVSCRSDKEGRMPQDKPGSGAPESSGENQGEGAREADRHYRERTRKFVESGRVDEAAAKAGEQDPEEAKQAEERGKQRAKEVDPEVHRDYSKPTRSSDSE